MTGLLIFILLSFVLFYFFTRIVWIRIIRGEKIKIEIHLPIFALHLIKGDDSGDNKEKKPEKISGIGYFRIITGVIARIKDATIEIKKIIIPIKTENFNKSAITRPIRQHALICAFIAYLRTKTRNIVVEDNAITLSPDVNVLHCYVTIKLRLYQFIHGLITVWHSTNEEKKRTKGERKNVRE